jgi:hypothetical protein
MTEAPAVAPIIENSARRLILMPPFCISAIAEAENEGFVLRSHGSPSASF